MDGAAIKDIVKRHNECPFVVKHGTNRNWNFEEELFMEFKSGNRN